MKAKSHELDSDRHLALALLQGPFIFNLTEFSQSNATGFTRVSTALS